MSVYKAINAVQADLAREGITKSRRNQQQGFSFRGIDDIYNALSPLLSKHGLCILPRVLSRECVERTSKSGSALFCVTVHMEFDFVAAEDGSRHVVSTAGEAQDSGDKATNKAMSAAYKYACMQAFSIPTEGDNDADAYTHEVAPKPAQEAMPEGRIVDWIATMRDATHKKHLGELMTEAKRACINLQSPLAWERIRAAAVAHGETLADDPA